MSSLTIPTRGNFNGLNLPEWDREMIESGFQAVESVEGGWDFLKTYEPPENEGFMFVKNPPAKLEEINNAVLARYSGHSGGSYGGTMRMIQYIAQKGWDQYAKEALEKYGAPKPETMEEKRKRFLALPTNMTLEEQVKAIEEFKDVPMTYFELRSRFG